MPNLVSRLVLASACAGGLASAQPGHGDDEVQVQLQLPAPAVRAGTPTVVAMAVQVGENRHARLDTAAGLRSVDLGRIEKGWTTFRLSALRWAAPGGGAVGAPAGGSCSGGFDANSSRRYQIVVRVEGETLLCEIR